jgi:hypothetical protein
MNATSKKLVDWQSFNQEKRSSTKLLNYLIML